MSIIRWRLSGLYLFLKISDQQTFPDVCINNIITICLKIKICFTDEWSCHTTLYLRYTVLCLLIFSLTSLGIIAGGLLFSVSAHYIVYLGI